jgi:hypothetical protein
VIGHRQIEAARASGWRPAAVFIEIGPAPKVGWSWQAPDEQLSNGEIPVVWTQGEKPEMADLRFLRSLRVHLELREGDPLLFWRWWEAIHDIEPSAVYGIDATGEVVAWRA